MNSSTHPIRILLADDHTLVRAGIRALLEKLPAVEVIAEANEGREVLQLARSCAPDVILMDIAMPGLNGLEATARLSKEFPLTRVIILSMHHHEEYVAKALKAGAAGYLLKKAATAELECALQHVARGEFYLSHELAARLPKNFGLNRIAHRKSPLDELTARQREILQLIAEGQNTKQIAEILQVSPKTVEYHRMKLMTAMNVHDIPGLVRLALRVGIIPPES